MRNQGQILLPSYILQFNSLQISLFAGVKELCCRPFIIVEVDPVDLVVWEVVHKAPGKRNQYRIYPGDSIMGEVRVSDE